MNLLPAYGRDYKSRAAVLADLKAGKDFMVRDGLSRDRPINLAQVLATPGGNVLVRFARLRKMAVIKRSELE